MKEIRWTLRELLSAEGVTAYALAQAMGGQSRQATIYRVTRGERRYESANTTLRLVGEILSALETLTGREIELGEVLIWEKTTTPHLPTT